MPVAFVQVGATRDGLDPYLDSARQRDMTAVLVETPAYLTWRREAGRRRFDLELAVERPQDAEPVVAALAGARIGPSLVLAGFERYAASAFGVAAALGTAPQPASGEPFVPPDKIHQRAIVSAKAPHLLQPRYCTDLADASRIAGPLVVKPADGGGGLGVFRVRGRSQLRAACASIASISNYGGGTFSGVLAEEQVRGVEYSIQGLVWRGRVQPLGVCEKIVTVDAAPAGLHGFREAAHIFVLGSPGLPDFVSVAQDCLDAAGYRDGPFHLDVIHTRRGPVFIEMGFRLSGSALVDLIRRATGQNWAEWVFACHLGEPPPPPAGPPPRVIGMATAFTEGELSAAAQARSEGHQVEVCRFTGHRGPANPGQTAPDLASDQMRHGGALGRVWVTADDVNAVRDLLHRFLAGRREV